MIDDDDDADGDDAEREDEQEDRQRDHAAPEAFEAARNTRWTGNYRYFVYKRRKI